MRKKGSPEDYHAEISVAALTQSPQTGEPNEHPTLYRIRRSQETYQLLLQESRRRVGGRRATGGRARGAAALGRGTELYMAGRHGSDAVQRLDLRYLEALRDEVGYGASGDGEGHCRSEEEERPHRCAHDCRPVALQPAAQLPC